MKTYQLIGIKVNHLTQDVMSTIEFSYASYVEARANKIELSKIYPDMNFHIDYNSNISLDEMMSIVNPKIDYKQNN